MQKLVLSGIFLFLIVFPSYAFADGPYLNIPPTNAFDKIRTDSGSVSAVNFSMPLKITGGTGVTVSANNSTHTVTITNTQSTNTHTGSYNQTLANNIIKNSGGQGLNFINGTNNPITLTNDPTRNQINITISSTGSGGGGVTSLNALTGALTIACVSGNTTCTTSGGNTITVNTAFNIVTTGLSAQTITKGLTLNALTLGGNAAGGNKNFTGLNQVNATRFYQGTNQVIDTLNQGSGISITGSGNSRTITNTGVLSAVTSINSQTGPAVSIIRQPSYTTITNNTNSIKVGIDATGVMELNGTQTATGSKTFNALVLGGDANAGSNGFTNAGHKSTFPLTSGTLCQTNQTGTCGTNSGVTSITGTPHNVTASSSTGAVTLNTGDNVVVTGGSAQTISKGITHSADVTMSGANIQLGSNILKTSAYQLSEKSVASQQSIIAEPQSGNSIGSFAIAPSGTQKAMRFFFMRTSDYVTNYEDLVLGTDIFGTGQYNFDVRTGGTGTLRPMIFSMQNTNLLSYDVANTITSYVQNIWTPISDPTKAFTNAIWKSSTNADVLKYRNNANTTTYNILSTLGAVTTSTPGNPSGTTSTTAVMMGLAGSITPSVSTRLDITICGQMANSVINDGVTVQLRYGTGTAPTNAGALTGTQLGASQTLTEKVAAQNSGFCVTGIATGLTIGTTYWIDAAVNAVTGGTASITGNTVKAHEI